MVDKSVDFAIEVSDQLTMFTSAQTITKIVKILYALTYTRCDFACVIRILISGACSRISTRKIIAFQISQ
jgi:hypothetical protein